MLSNLLLVLGMCFFCGGVNRIEQFFNTTVAQTAASLLALSVGALIIPTAFTWGPTGIQVAKSRVDEKVSYGTAIIMLLIYGAYLIFQLKSHKAMYNAPSQKVEKRKGAKKGEGDVKKAFAGMGGVIGATSGGKTQQEGGHFVTDDEEEEPVLSFWGAMVTLCAATALVGLCAEYLVSSINAVTCKYHVSDYFCSDWFSSLLLETLPSTLLLLQLRSRTRWTWLSVLPSVLACRSPCSSCRSWSSSDGLLERI